MAGLTNHLQSDRQQNFAAAAAATQNGKQRVDTVPSLTSPRCAGHPSGESGKEPGLSPPPSPGPVTANHLTSSFPKLHETSGSAGSAPQQPAPGSYPHRDPGPGAATSQGPATSQPGPALPSSAAQQVNGGGAAAVVAQLSQHNNLQEHLQQQQKVITRRLLVYRIQL